MQRFGFHHFILSLMETSIMPWACGYRPRRGEIPGPEFSALVFVFVLVSLRSLLHSCLLTFVRVIQWAPSGGCRNDRSCPQALGLRGCSGGQSHRPVIICIIKMPGNSCTNGLNTQRRLFSNLLQQRRERTQLHKQKVWGFTWGGLGATQDGKSKTTLGEAWSMWRGHLSFLTASF